MNAVIVAKIVIDTAITLVRTFYMDLLDLFCDYFVFNSSGAFTSRNPPVIRCSGYLQKHTSFLNGVSAFRTILLNCLVKMTLSYLR